MTAIELSEGGMIAISTSDADRDDEANTVTFTPGTATNISNPLNGEIVEVGSLHFPLYLLLITLHSLSGPSCPQQWSEPSHLA